MKGREAPFLPSVMAPNTMSTEDFEARAILKVSFEESNLCVENTIE